MAKAQAGSSSRLNQIFGFTNSIKVSESDKSTYQDKVFQAGTFLHDENGFLYHTDGEMTLSEVLQHPIVNKNYDVLTPAEREMITKFNQANGFVATDNENKINDDQLNIVQNGKIVESYLSKYINEGMIKPEVIPMDIRAHMKFLKTYAELEQIDKDYRSGLFFVIDATGDPTVKKGWAIYVWEYDEGVDDPDVPAQDKSGHWKKIQEGEGIDYDYDSITTHDTVEKVGAVMYDHTLFVQYPTLDQLNSLLDPVVNPSFISFKSKIEDYDKTEVPLGASITTQYVPESEHTIVFTVAEESTLKLVGFEDGECDVDNSRTLTSENIEELNTKLQNIKVVTGITGGSFTMVLDTDCDERTVTVTTLPFKDPTVEGETTSDIKVNTKSSLGIQLSTEGVDSDKTYTVTVISTNCTLDDDTGAPVLSGSSWSIAADTVANINTKLKKATVMVDGSGTSGTVSIQYAELTEPVTITYNPIFDEPAIEGSEGLIVANGNKVALGVTLSTTNVNPVKQYTVQLTSTGVKLLNSDVSANGVSISQKTVSAINEQLANIKVIGTEEGGTVTIAITDGASKTIQVASAYKPLTVDAVTDAKVDDINGVPLAELLTLHGEFADPTDTYPNLKVVGTNGVKLYLNAEDTVGDEVADFTPPDEEITLENLTNHVKTLRVVCINGESGKLTVEFTRKTTGGNETPNTYTINVSPDYELRDAPMLATSPDPIKIGGEIKLQQRVRPLNFTVSPAAFKRDQSFTLRMYSYKVDLYDENCDYLEDILEHETGYAITGTVNEVNAQLAKLQVCLDLAMRDTIEVWFNDEREKVTVIIVERETPIVED